MTGAVVGFDTSNYRTSVAAVSPEGEILLNFRELLPVQPGERGLRQSEAVFAHLKGLRTAEAMLRNGLRGTPILAVAASTRPRDREESYMPVFQAGWTAGTLLAASLNVPFVATSHQQGHLAAAALGTPLEKAERFLAVHLSGGTTDLLAVRNREAEQIGGSLDLHAGQLVDRVGVKLGLPFPSGPELENLALKGHAEGRLGCSLEQGDLFCHLSGAETRAQRWIEQGTLSPEDTAREVYDLLARTISRMLCAGARKTGLSAALVTGGVAGSPLFRQLLGDRCRGRRDAPKLCFGRPDLSGDNAVGVALIGRDTLK